MKYIVISMIAIFSLCLGAVANATAPSLSNNEIATKFCKDNVACKDIVILNLNGYYYEGINERRTVSIGTLINNKKRSMDNYCQPDNDAICDEYKRQLILQYIKGLISR